MNFRAATQEDLAFVVEHSISRGVLSQEPIVTDFTYVLEHDGAILGIGGIKLLTHTSAWAWVNLTVYALQHLKTSYRVIRDWTNNLAEIHNLVRLQAYVDVNFPEALRLTRHLGFRVESHMEKFLGCRDAYMVVKIFRRDGA